MAHGLDMVARRAPMWWTSGASRVDRGPSRCPKGKSCAGWCRWSRRWRRTCGCRSTPSSAPWPRRRWQPGRRSSTTSRRRCGRWRPSPGWDGWPCTCRARPARCSTTRATTTSSPRCTAFCADGPRAALEAGVDEVWVDPGIGFGKTVDAQPGAVAPPSRARGRGPARARGDESQELPRAPGGGADGGTGRGGRNGCRAPSPPPRGPCWRGRRWCGSTTWRARCEAATLVGTTPPGRADRSVTGRTTMTERRMG